MDKKTILIVEDEVDAAKTLAAALKTHDFEVQFAPDAIFGAQEAVEKKPDLILLDLIIPAGGGLAVLERVRNSVHLQGVPVIVLTGSENPIHKGRAEALGISAYRTKPYAIEELINDIKGLLGDN
tara:strand:+ start:384 stop:758 length:375 start_codon:yes stop_codon:yes gene_type:complete